ncbi:MAG: PBP1A family penicillin-binding protein [Candidatus Obscuribacterales bacterium]|nr:PBP1A family penicillin-binding protein [Candidatus Obscuribacterales bacterium]
MPKRTKPDKKTRTPNKKRGPVWRFFQFIFWSIFAVVAIGGGYVGAKIWQYVQNVPDIAVLERYEPIEAVQVFDKYDHLVCTVEGDEDRRVVKLGQISPQMQQAMLAAEDHHFYEHHGINPLSIGRAMLANVQAGQVVEGGSTITQQLVKNIFFQEAGRNIDRKVKEAVVSFEIERRYPKEKILELYLNQVYFGNNAYGIERAAFRYFDKSAASLSLAESAFIAGLVKAPSELSTQANRKAAISRQHEIIKKMVEYGYVTEKQANAALKETLKFKKGIDPLQKYPYYISYVLEQLRDQFSQTELRKQGLRVFTNLDPAVQELAEKTLNDGIKKAPKGVNQGALVVVQVKDGAVLALVGGVGDFWKNQFNRATNPHTAGSSFKPFVYLCAFAKRAYAPDSIIDDSPITIKQGWGLPLWQPKNFDHKFMGRIPIRTALALSRNVPSVKVAQQVGVGSIIETARLCGITSKLDANLSLSLGTSAVSPLELAGAYSTFARGGVMISPQVIRKIENTRGQVVQAIEPKYDKAFDTEPVAELVSVLQDVVNKGTGTQAKLPDRPVAGKTGTADEGKDIWFCGFTPDTVAVLWGGNDDNLAIPGHNITGGTIMAKIWKTFMTAYYEKNPTASGQFIAPSRTKIEKPEDEDNTSASGTNEGGTLSPGIPKLVPITPKEDAPPPPYGYAPGTTTGQPTSAPTPGADGMPPVAPNTVPAQDPQLAPALPTN